MIQLDQMKTTWPPWFYRTPVHRRWKSQRGRNHSEKVQVWEKVVQSSNDIQPRSLKSQNGKYLNILLSLNKKKSLHLWSISIGFVLRYPDMANVISKLVGEDGRGHIRYGGVPHLFWSRLGITQMECEFFHYDFYKKKHPPYCISRAIESPSERRRSLGSSWKIRQ